MDTTRRISRAPAGATSIANDTDYGLAATVWTSDVRRAMRMTEAIKAGTVGVNGYQLEPNSPFGGFRQSGLGCEGGRAALRLWASHPARSIPDGRGGQG